MIFKIKNLNLDNGSLIQALPTQMSSNADRFIELDSNATRNGQIANGQPDQVKGTRRMSLKCKIESECNDFIPNFKENLIRVSIYTDK